LSGDDGTVLYGPACPTGVVDWSSAEIEGISDQGADAVKVRFVNADGDRFYLDDESMTFEPVSDADDWTSEWSLPSLLSNVDLWRWPSFQVEAHLEATDEVPEPVVGDLKIVFDLPTWEGAVAQAVRAIVQAVADVRPILIHEETLESAGSTFDIGVPHIEHGHRLTELVRISVDGVERSGTLSGGRVTALGPPIPAGSIVKVAVRYRPNTSVKRIADVLIVDETPAWVVSNIVDDPSAGGLNGEGGRVDVNGLDVRLRRIDGGLRIRGVCGRQADAFAMRAALQEALGSGIEITLDSGRAVTAHLDGFVSIVPGDVNQLPEVRATVRIPMVEAVGATRVHDARRTDAEASNGIGLPLSNTISIGITDAEDLPESITEADAESTACLT
jgi:hypothetical protein